MPNVLFSKAALSTTRRGPCPRSCPKFGTTNATTTNTTTTAIWHERFLHRLICSNNSNANVRQPKCYLIVKQVDFYRCEIDNRAFALSRMHVYVSASCSRTVLIPQRECVVSWPCVFRFQEKGRKEMDTRRKKLIGPSK
jgi:hypothetical protein